eukprot:scaffold18025_cov42-Phaeocystis_antarctica.AAC.1
MEIALPGLLSTAMARQHLDLFAMWFAGGGVTQIFGMPPGRKQRFTVLRGLKSSRSPHPTTPLISAGSVRDHNLYVAPHATHPRQPPVRAAFYASHTPTITSGMVRTHKGHSVGALERF